MGCYRELAVVAATTLIIGLAFGQICASAAAAQEGPTTEPGYVVILEDGSRLPSATKPFSAFGKVRFTDASGRTRLVPERVSTSSGLERRTQR